MKCFLHIGTEKTATTTIQAFFHINRPQLLKKGFIYTKSAGIGNNRSLSVAAYDPNRRDEFTSSHNISTIQNLLDFQLETISNLRKEIEESMDGASSIIISSEHFQSRLTRITEISRLKSILHGLNFTDISVIVYLRRPSDIANSLYSTALKCGNHLLDEPPPPDHPYYNNICHHENTIKKFGSIFGSSSIIPRLFDRNEFINKSIIDDIMSVIGIPEDETYSFPENQNESLSWLGVKLLKRLNKLISTLDHNRPNPLRANLNTYIEKNFSGSKYVMPSHLYEAYEKTFQDSNEWVRETYFPNRECLFSKSTPEDSSLNLSDTELDNIANCIASIWRDKQMRILSLLNDANR